MQLIFFLTSMLGGIALAGTIYFVLFDQLSETMLIQLSGLWFVPFVFGLYGLLGRMAARKSAQSAATAAGAGTAFAVILRGVFRALPPIISLAIALVFLVTGLPLSFIKQTRPMLIAVLGVAMWIPLLVVFLVFIFPSL